MATVYGVNATLTNNVPIDKVDVAEIGGRVRRMYDSYEAGVVASGDIIALGAKIPKGARIIDWTLLTDDLGGTATAAILQANPDTGAAVSLMAAAIVVGDGAIISRPLVGDIDLLPHTTTDETQMQLLTSADDTVAGTIKLEVLYTID